MKTLFIQSTVMLWLLQTSSLALSQAYLEVSPATRTALGISVAVVDQPNSFNGITTSALVIAPPGQSHPVMSPFSGVLLRPLVVPGMLVQEGQEVAVLHSPDYSSAYADLETKRLAAEHDEHLAERANELQKLGLRSDQEVEEAHHEAKAARLAYDAVRNQLAGIAVKDGAGKYRLVAPASGVVTHIAADGMVEASTPVMTIFEGKEYWAKAQVPERLMSFLTIGGLIGLANSATQGKVVAIDPEVDAVSRSIEVLVQLPTDLQWRIGQLIHIEFETSVQKDALSVPARSLVRIGGQEMVFVETDTGFRVVAVTILGRSRDQVVVIAELNEADKVVVSGLAALKNMAEGA